MNLSGVDLNLMTALEALLQERHVSRAAERIGRSQPAMSNALARLRELFDDPLFVRTAQGMQLTPHANEIRPAIEAGLEQIRAALNKAGFDPRTSARHFVVATADAGAAYFLPKLLPALRAEAPNITLRIVDGWANEAIEALDRGAIDFAIGVFFQQQEDYRSELLLSMREVCVGDAGNRALREGSMSLARFLELPKIMLERHDRGSAAMSLLSTSGHRSTIVLTLPHFAAAARAVVGTDLVTVLPEPMVNSLPDRDSYLVRPLMFELPDVAVRLIWSPRNNADAAHVWFRNLISRSLVEHREAPAIGS